MQVFFALIVYTNGVQMDTHEPEPEPKTLVIPESKDVDAEWKSEPLVIASFNMLMKGLADVKIPRTMMLPHDRIPTALQGKSGQTSLFYTVAEELAPYYQPWHQATFECVGHDGEDSGRPKECATNWFGPDCDQVRYYSVWSSHDLKADTETLCMRQAQHLAPEIKKQVATNVKTNGSGEYVNAMNKTTRVQLTPLPVALTEVLQKLLPSADPKPIAAEMQKRLSDYNRTVMDWSVREDRVAQYVHDLASDMVGLVEFDAPELENHAVLKPEYHFLSYTRGKVGFLWKKSIGWKCETKMENSFSRVKGLFKRLSVPLDGEVDEKKFAQELVGTKSFMIVSCEKGSRSLVTAVAHLTSDPQDPKKTIRGNQLKLLDSLVAEVAAKKKNAKVVLMGDMNIDLHTQGDIWKAVKGDAKAIHFGGKSLRLANSTIEVTSVTPQRREMLDYIWTDLPAVDASAPLNKSVDFIPAYNDLTKINYPSDHIAVRASIGK